MGIGQERAVNNRPIGGMAIDGLLAPIGRFKGTGLAMIMSILSSMISRASYGTELGNMEDVPKPGQDGHFVAAIQVGAFEDVRRFKSRVDCAIQQVHQSQLAPRFDRIQAPGKDKSLKQEAYRKGGIPLNATRRTDLHQVATDFGVDVASYASI